MKRKEKIVPILIVLAFFVLGALPAQAVPSLCDWAFNVDGVTYEDSWGDSMPTTGTLDSNGLGTLAWNTSSVGAHTFIAFFDHEIDEYLNTYYNEYGTAVNAPAAGQSWEIDEPGFDYPYGDIYDNVLDSTTTTGSLLDNKVFGGVPGDMPNDISMAMGWDFSLAADETATISLILSEIMPTAGFYLAQTDPETGVGTQDYSPEQTIYFSSILEIEGGGGPGPGPEPVPEPSTLLLMGIGLMGLLGVQRKRASRKKV